MIRAIVGAALNISLPLGGLWWSLSHTRRSIVFAFALNWALMAFAFIGFLVFPLRFGRTYYDVQPFERRGRPYERIGVRGFQKLLRVLHVHGAAPFPRFAGGTDGVRRLVDDTRGPETAHALIFVIVLVVAADALRRGWWDTALWLVAFDIVLNAYPVFSMRHIRARIAHLAR